PVDRLPALRSLAIGSNGFHGLPNRPDNNTPPPFPATPHTPAWPPSTAPSSPAHSHPETHLPTPRSSRPIPPASADSPALPRRLARLPSSRFPCSWHLGPPWRCAGPDTADPTLAPVRD